MKKNIFASMLVLLAAFSCQNKSGKQDHDLTADTTSSSSAKQQTTISTEQQSTQSSVNKFDINKVPITNNFEGSFPYFKLPDGYMFNDPNSYRGKGVVNDVDKEYFYNHGIYFPMEGKTFKAQIRVDDEKFKDKKFSKLEVQKSFDELIAGIGGVKINNGEPLQSGQKDSLDKTDANAYRDGYMHSCHNFDDVHTYVIRTKDKTVFVQYNIGADQSDITVLEPKVFENKMSIIPAAEIQKQLDEKGKAILYINFDTDKATLKPDGKQYVDEILKLLNNKKELKLSIEGHTDNTGEAKYNKDLSKQRATTVLKELTDAGITPSRLQVQGFGSEKPLVNNDTESNKAKNRRVELIKI